MKKCHRDVLSPLMPQLTHIPCCAHILNLIGDSLRTFSRFQILKNFLEKIKEVFVYSPARQRRYLTHLKMHGIFSPYHIVYWSTFFKEEAENDKKNNNLEIINSYLQNEREFGVITIYLNFFSIYAKEFVQDLDFFQQSKKPIFPFVESRLQQLTSYIETNRNANYFSPFLENLITSLQFNVEEFYIIFREAFKVAYEKFKVHIPNHPAHLLFCAKFNNPSDELLREWGIYCELNNEIINEIELDQYWLNKASQLPILYKIAFDYIWLPVSSCSVERSFSMYNSLLDSDCQNLSLDSLKRLNMLYFNGF
ncbi:hypothetical protein Glove_41g190 [Diversispora epigaea]|uniref:HAT C-terminal dimerisation domain-containing protein n=1 Tax=Diversispora epigaea TaxID=1348612 RepID=A0A397JJM4_9GLOM|nr:hypothetical protein Glove_41g190 [Diversispora epigaea]